MALLSSCSKIVLTHDLENPEPHVNFTPNKGNINAVVWNHNSMIINHKIIN